MGGSLKSAVALVAIFAGAVLIASCGGSEDDPAASSAGSSSHSESDTRSGSSSAGALPSSPRGEESSAGTSDLPERGTVSPQSTDFQKYSAKGKLHLAEFGEEADSGARTAVEGVVVPYLEAIGQGEWASACAHLLARTKAEIAKLDPSGGASCGEAMAAVEKASGGADGAPIQAPDGIASLRIEKDGLAGPGAGFALFHGSDGNDHWLAVKNEGGKWRILSIAPQPFR